MYKKKNLLVHGSTVDHLLSIYTTLGQIPSTLKESGKEGKPETIIIKQLCWAGEDKDVAQWLGTIVVLEEDRSSVPSTHIRRCTTSCNSSSRDPMLFLISKDICINVHRHTYTYK